MGPLLIANPEHVPNLCGSVHLLRINISYTGNKTIRLTALSMAIINHYVYTVLKQGKLVKAFKLTGQQSEYLRWWKKWLDIIYVLRCIIHNVAKFFIKMMNETRFYVYRGVIDRIFPPSVEQLNACAVLIFGYDNHFLLLAVDSTEIGECCFIFMYCKEYFLLYFNI